MLDRPDKFVPKGLRAAAAIYEERNAMYGDNYKRYGSSILQMFGPVELRTADDYNRFAIFTHIMTRLTRYAANFSRGGHDDSLDDICVYTMMLKELDYELRENGVFNGDSK
jgi:hypothetical protein